MNRGSTFCGGIRCTRLRLHRPRSWQRRPPAVVSMFRARFVSRPGSFGCDRGLRWSPFSYSPSASAPARRCSPSWILCCCGRCRTAIPIGSSRCGTRTRAADCRRSCCRQSRSWTTARFPSSRAPRRGGALASTWSIPVSSRFVSTRSKSAATCSIYSVCARKWGRGFQSAVHSSSETHR
jgi:hypothetical protein